MNLLDVANTLQLDVLSGTDLMNREFGHGYVSDMLSDVIAHAEAGSIWITLQLHLNIVAVASMKDLAAIIIVHGRRPDAGTLHKAEQEKIPILSTHMNAYQTAGRLYMYCSESEDD